jgi:hypothetical protein
MAISEADIWIRDNFPRLRSGRYQVTSLDTEDYNCLAWAAGENFRKWDPTEPSHHWPGPRQLTIAAFNQAYGSIGYVPCSDGTLEQGFEKIAIYVTLDGRPKHAARQLASGAWTSKLGDGWDIEHPTVEDVSNDLSPAGYGLAVAFMRRPT